MRKLLGVVTVSSLCLALSIGLAGCTTGGGKDKFKAVGDKTGVTLEGKDKTATMSFTKDVKSVSDDKDGVKATKKGKDVTFTQTVDSPDADKQVTFEVHGPGEKETVKVTVTLAKKGGAAKPADKVEPKAGDKVEPKSGDKVEPKTPSMPEALKVEGAAPTEITFKKGEATKIKFSGAKVDTASPTDPKDAGKYVSVTADKIDNSVTITTLENPAMDMDITVVVKASGGAPDHTLKFKLKKAAK